MTRARVGNMVTLAMLVVALALLGRGAAVWVRDGRKIAELRTRHDQHAAEIKTVRTELNAVGLRYRAFQTSAATVPDSLRKALKSEHRQEEKSYQRDIRRLEMSEYDHAFEMKQLKRREANAVAARKQQAQPFFLGGGGALLLAATTFAATRQRRKPLDGRPSAALS